MFDRREKERWMDRWGAAEQVVAMEWWAIKQTIQQLWQLTIRSRTWTRLLIQFRRLLGSYINSTLPYLPSMLPPSSLSYKDCTFSRKPTLSILFVILGWLHFCLIRFFCVCSNSLVSELDNMVKLSEKCNIQVPMEVLKWVCPFFYVFLFAGWFDFNDLIVVCFLWLMCSLIDDGKNPDEFTRDVINSCIAKNQVTKGKTDAFKVL